MKRKRLLIILMPILLVAGYSQAATTNDKLLFLGNNNIPPMIYVQNDQATGLVVDIAHQVAREVNLDIEVRAMDWTQAQEMVLNGNADALLQINRSPDREALYDFSDPLLESYFTIFRRDSRIDIRNIASLDGKLVGVEASGYPLILVQKYPEIKVQIIDSWKAGFDLVNAGMLDAVIVDRWVGEYELAVKNINGITAVQEPVETSFSYIAVKKGNRQLLDQINLGLAKMRADGSMDRILNSWSSKEVVYFSMEQIEYLYIAGIFMLVILILMIILLFYARALSRAKRQAELLSTTDDLTQLHNRRFFFPAGERELYIARRHQRPIAVMRFDVDRFKQINDQWGHAVGDEVLKTIAKILKSSVRSGDICGRLGGDEFSLILSETDPERAMLIAERIKCSIGAQVLNSGNDVLRFSVSVGLAVANREWPTLEELLALSDKALYQAKESGRNKVVVFSPNASIKVISSHASGFQETTPLRDD